MNSSATAPSIAIEWGKMTVNSLGGGGFKYVFIFIPTWQDDPKIDEHMFANGWNETTNLHLIISEWSEISFHHIHQKHPTAPLSEVGQAASIYIGVSLNGGTPKTPRNHHFLVGKPHGCWVPPF